MSRAGKQLSITVGITSCYGKAQLLDSIKSLNQSQGVKFETVLVTDRFPLEKDLKKKIIQERVKIIENSYESSAFVKQLQILDECKSDILILSQDDLLYEPKMIQKIVETFNKNPEVTFVGVRNEPLAAENWFEAGVNVGTRLNNRIAQLWNGSDNYLAVLGRIMAFRTEWLRKMYVEKDAISLDAYLYLENKQMGGKYMCLWDTYIRFRNPQNMAEQMRKSSRFQNSRFEMESYKRFGELDREYQIPIEVIAKAGLEELRKNIAHFVIYAGIFLYTRFLRQNPSYCLTANWEVDLSTKKI